MSREIKFRAWDDCQKKFHYYDMTIGCWCEDSDFKIISTSVMRDMPKEQFTGLKDKNAVEIYEGDVVRKIANEGTAYHSVDSTDIVKIDHQGAYPCGAYDGDCGDSEKGEYWEVMGNKYENRDLLQWVRKCQNCDNMLPEGELTAKCCDDPFYFVAKLVSD